MTGYFCGKKIFLPGSYKSLKVFSIMALADTRMELLIWAFLPEDRARASIDHSKSKSAPINAFHSVALLGLARECLSVILVVREI